MKRILVIILLIAILCTSIFVFLGCTSNIDTTKTTCEHGTPLDIDGWGCLQCNPYPDPWSIEEIEEYVREKFFNEDGTAKMSYWNNSIKGYDPKYTEIPIEDDFINLYPLPTEITGFDVQFIKDVDGEETYYLVEFEPSGYIIGKRDQTVISFYYYPSPYKILNVDSDNRYAVFRNSTAAYYKGKLINLGIEAFKNTSKLYSVTRDPNVYYYHYDFEQGKFVWAPRSELEQEGGSADEN